MGRPTNYEKTPYNPSAPPEQKAREFDEQFRTNEDYVESGDKVTYTDMYPDEKGRQVRGS